MAGYDQENFPQRVAGDVEDIGESVFGQLGSLMSWQHSHRQRSWLKIALLCIILAITAATLHEVHDNSKELEKIRTEQAVQHTLLDEIRAAVYSGPHLLARDIAVQDKRHVDVPPHAEESVAQMLEKVLEDLAVDTCADTNDVSTIGCAVANA